MSTELEIIIPVRNPDARLARTATSLVAQTDRHFSVLLSDDCSTTGLNHLKSAQQQLAAAGITVRRMQTPVELGPLEHWNWAHGNGRAEWLKPLSAGSELKPAYVEALRQRIVGQPQAQLIRCDAETTTEWGPEIVQATFPQSSVKPAEFLNYFPTPIRWLTTASNMAFHRTAWQATGGCSTQLRACAILNLNIVLALHFGLENIHEPLVTIHPTAEFALSENSRVRVNLGLEFWLILRQARNYCLSAKLPWSKNWLLLRAMAAMSS